MCVCVCVCVCVLVCVGGGVLYTKAASRYFSMFD